MKKFRATALADFLVVAHAQKYPAKTITIVVPVAAGGSSDRLARDLAEAVRKPLGAMSVIVENLVGGGSCNHRSPQVARQVPK